MVEIVSKNEPNKNNRSTICLSVYANLINPSSKPPTLCGLVLERREAIRVLRKICKYTKDESAISFVFLEQTRNVQGSRRKGFDLHIRMQVDEATREIIESLTRKRGLSVKVSNRDFVVSALEAPMEIVV
jgi:hypothetical protein